VYQQALRRAEPGETLVFHAECTVGIFGVRVAQGPAAEDTQPGCEHQAQKCEPGEARHTPFALVERFIVLQLE
jgi:hypothetical protein